MWIYFLVREHGTLYGFGLFLLLFFRRSAQLLHPECVHKIFPDCVMAGSDKCFACAVVKLSHIYLYISTFYGLRCTQCQFLVDPLRHALCECLIECTTVYIGRPPFMASDVRIKLPKTSSTHISTEIDSEMLQLTTNGDGLGCCSFKRNGINHAPYVL